MDVKYGIEIYKQSAYLDSLSHRLSCIGHLGALPIYIIPHRMPLRLVRVSVFVASAELGKEYIWT